MLRSSRGYRVSDELVVDSQPQSSDQQGSETVPLNRRLLPMFNPLSRAAEKERSRLRSAENAVHIIPFVLALCGFILLFFSGLESSA
ncbi:hypothetical protein V6N13_047012 [Hibiscus sabdariffa]|uniref:Uncharacterized protein n=2 Tax=Hibiscus sabdariffa TaxID=183260 RepID=A0ABR1ZA61_9ROSI